MLVVNKHPLLLLFWAALCTQLSRNNFVLQDKKINNSSLLTPKYLCQGSTGLSAGEGVDPDQVALEEEVVKLMATNVTMAMHYLQTKGLCLMPIALATAISSGKAPSSSSSASVSEEWKKFQNYSSSSSSSNSNSSLASDSNIRIRNVSEAAMINGCNGAIKPVRNTFCTATQLKPKT